MQNSNMYADIKIESIFWLFALKKDRYISSLVIKIDNVKIANIVIKEKFVIDYILHECMRYNLICRIKQYFNCYKYDHVLVYCQKCLKYKACLGLHRTSKYSWNKTQKCPLCKNAYTSWNKQCEYKKKKYLKIETAKQNMPHLYEVKSKTNPPRNENFGDMKLLLKP